MPKHVWTQVRHRTWPHTKVVIQKRMLSDLSTPLSAVGPDACGAACQRQGVIAAGPIRTARGRATHNRWPPGLFLIAPLLAPQRKSLHTETARRLAVSIIQRQISAGSPLPVETDLLDTYDISRPSLREVIRTLAAKGLISAKTRVGTHVRPAEDWRLLDTDVLAWHLLAGHEAQLRAALLPLCHAIEVAGASQAAQCRNPATCDDLGVAVAYLTAALARGDAPGEIFAAHAAFRLTVCLTSGVAGLLAAKPALEACFLAQDPNQTIDGAKQRDALNNLAQALLRAVRTGDVHQATKLGQQAASQPVLGDPVAGLGAVLAGL